MTASKRGSALRSPWFWAMISMVLTAIGGIIWMIYMAGDSSTRMVNPDYYKRGEHYEENMLKQMARDPGWKMKISIPEFVDVAVVTPFTFNITDKDGAPIDPDSVIFYAYRPSGAQYDFSLPMERVAKGEYRVEASFSLKGAWDILVAVTNGEDEYQETGHISAGVDSR